MEDLDMRIFGNKLRNLRQRAGMTQKELAEAAYLSESALRSYELGVRAPKRDSYGRLAKALGVQPELLTAPQNVSGMELIFILLENEQTMRLKTTKTDSGKPALTADSWQGDSRLIYEFLDAWGEKQRQLEDKEIAREKYEEWKISYNPWTDAMDVLA